ncbi:PAS domain S-box-containing protein [Desulfatibacillum alkenivorans DSM 16219]|uniref:histidine kinase n=1 Tax=Desulfatibacillum alkenivorans DSM 16219 TaxID=1121393 RepID=A0A1M6HBA0_9BACT|nr:response regulator [Desulfatibacillum alkenivorans]SHJ19389.1 PAS domain S-box-containing protein [Desulfatibacillum alkenivorans DSM 16219]
MNTIISDEPIKILTIDDEEAIRQSFAAFLEDFGYEVLSAPNGRVGLEIFKEEKPHLILVDLRMPEVDGLEVLSSVTRASPETPIIVVSGTGVIADAVEALHLGAWDYILKPIKNLSILLHSIEKALERARLIKENREYQEHLEFLVDSRSKKILEYSNRLKHIADRTRQFTIKQSIGDLAPTILKTLSENIGVAGGSLFLRNGQGLELIYALDPGHQKRVIPLPPPPRSVTAHLFEQKEAFIVPDIHSDNRFASSGWSGYKNGSLMALPLQDSEGEIQGVVTLHNKLKPPFTEQDLELGDIIASHSMEAIRNINSNMMLRESEKRFREVVELSPYPIAIVGPDRKHTLLNAKFTELFGYTMEEVPTMDAWREKAYPDPELRAAVERHWQMTINGVPVPEDDPILQDRKVICKDGTARTVESKIIPIGESNLIVMNDITDRKRAENDRNKLEIQLRQAQKMEAIGTLAGGIAHDFNNILSPIIGYTEMAMVEAVENSTMERNLNEVMKAAERAKELVFQILTFSRQTEIEKKPVQAQLVIREALKLLRSSIPASIQFEKKINKECGPVLADPTQIHQLLMNLCTNAYHAMGESGGVLTVEFDEAAVLSDGNPATINLKPGKYVRLTISDTGHGMTQAVQEKIFDPYFTTKAQGKGTGLGLAVVHGIVKSMEGDIQVDSKPGRGTSFIIYLPQVESIVQNAAPRTNASLPRGDERILFVDDEGPVALMGKQMLERLGYHVTVETSSIAALEIFKAQPDNFDLVVTDMSMPLMTGDVFARKILETRPNMPIVLCTGFSEVVTQENAQAMGISEYIMKPMVMSEIANTVRKVLDGL